MAITQAQAPRPKRTRLDIWAAILDALVAGDATLNRLVVAGNLNRTSAREYVQQLVSEGLIQTKHERFLKYSITNDGIRWLKTYRGLVSRGEDRRKRQDRKF